MTVTSTSTDRAARAGSRPKLTRERETISASREAAAETRYFMYSQVAERKQLQTADEHRAMPLHQSRRQSAG